MVINWESAHSLVEDAISGAKIAPRPPALAVAHLALCLQQEAGLVCSRLALLWYSLNPLFCEQVRVCLRLELFVGKLSLSLSLFIFSLSGYPTFGLLSQVSFLRLSSGHSGLVLTLSMQPAPPCSAPLSGGKHECLGYFSTGNCDWVCSLWFFFPPPGFDAL